jgi:dipeptidyl-peptidase-4
MTKNSLEYRWTRVTITALASFALLPQPAHAQLTAADYARAERFLSWNASRLVSGTDVAPRWLTGDRFWYRNRSRDGFEFLLVDMGGRVQRPAFDHARLAAALSVAADTSYEPHKLPFREFEFTDDGRSIRFEVRDSVSWTCDINGYTCAGPDTIPGDPVTEVESPDGRWVAFERDENLWVRDLTTHEDVQLSDDGEPDFGYAVNPEGCCYVITGRRDGAKQRPILSWSPDSKKIATLKLDEREVELLHLLETETGRPTLHSYHYALPGDSAIPMFELYVFDVESRSKVKVDADPQPMDFGVMAEDSVWITVQWGDASEQLYFSHRTRERNAVSLMRANATSGETHTILEERNPTFVELNLALLEIPNWRPVSGGRETIWFSERDGWGHLYLYDTSTGTLENQITAGPWLVVQLLHVDEPSRWVYFTAVGREADRDIYFRHLYRARLDGSSVELLTPEDADHNIRLSPSGRYLVDTYSTRNKAPVTVLRSLDGRILQTLQEADVSRLQETGWRWPEHFVVKARDGVTDIHGFLHLPSDFDPQKSYPLIDYIYPGPQVGPIGWRGFRPDPSGNPHALAELGFIVIQLDAMGTPFRSKAFHDRWYGDMGDNGIPDHVAAIKQLAAASQRPMRFCAIPGSSKSRSLRQVTTTIAATSTPGESAIRGSCIAMKMGQTLTTLRPTRTSRPTWPVSCSSCMARSTTTCTPTRRSSSLTN